MSAPVFEAWPKTPRLFRDIVVTEKIDGTNVAVIIEESNEIGFDAAWITYVQLNGVQYRVGAQSRTRIITPGKATDNFGFAQWVGENAEALVATLGPGRHFGEWWGKGIQRGYGIAHRRFSLFNTHRYEGLDFVDNGLDNVDIVPPLYQGPFDMGRVTEALLELEAYGSHASRWIPGGLGAKPEGVIVYHGASRQTFKALLENDHLPKTVAELEEVPA